MEMHFTPYNKAILLVSWGRIS